MIGNVWCSYRSEAGEGEREKEKGQLLFVLVLPPSSNSLDREQDYSQDSIELPQSLESIVRHVLPSPLVGLRVPAVEMLEVELEGSELLRESLENDDTSVDDLGSDTILRDER